MSTFSVNTFPQLTETVSFKDWLAVRLRGASARLQGPLPSPTKAKLKPFIRSQFDWKLSQDRDFGLCNIYR